MTVEELVAPLYATTRAFLKPILAHSAWEDGSAFDHHPPALAAAPVQGAFFFDAPESGLTSSQVLQHL